MTDNFFDGKKCDVCGSPAYYYRARSTGEEELWCNEHAPDDVNWWGI